MLRAVLFDFDGVIADTEPVHWAVLNEVLGLHGIEQISWERYCQEMLGLDDRGLFGQAYARAALPLSRAMLQGLIEEKSGRFLERVREQKVVLAGVAELIESLSEKYLLAICSGALRREIEAILTSAGLRRHFRAIVSSEDVERGKPDPEGYLLAMRRLQEAAQLNSPLRAAECLVIEDSYPGIEAGKEAGMMCLAVATSVQRELLLEADAVVGSLAEVSAGSLGSLFEE
jgi:beta-phosphoglucomutase